MDVSPEPEMIAVPPGRVTLSDRRTQRSWPVDLSPYRLAACPVTRIQYERIAGHPPITAPGGRQANAWGW